MADSNGVIALLENVQAAYFSHSLVDRTLSGHFQPLYFRDIPYKVRIGFEYPCISGAWAWDTVSGIVGDYMVFGRDIVLACR